MRECPAGHRRLVGRFVVRDVLELRPSRADRLVDGTMRPLWGIFASAMQSLIVTPPAARLWYDDRDIPFLREDVKDQADVFAADSSSLAVLVTGGFEPDAAVDAVISGDLNRLKGKHTGLYSVQLQPPGTDRNRERRNRAAAIVERSIHMKAPLNNICRAAPFELRDDSDGFTLEGYAAVFDTPTRIDSWEGMFDETISGGAFAKTIRERVPVLQFDHGRDGPTGSVPIGKIEQLSEDKNGLFVRARLHDNTRVEPIRQAIASGAIDGMSFRFRVLREEWDETGDIPVRTIREVDLFELGPVVFPAYEATTVGVRSLLADLDDNQRAELVRDLAAEIARNTSSSDADSVTSDETPDAALEGTSGDDGTPAERHLPMTFAERQQFARRVEMSHAGIGK